MKKSFRLLFIGFLFQSYFAIGQTKALKAYTIPTTGNEPNIKLNSTILVSNLVDYNIGDFLCYDYLNEDSIKEIRVQRLAAKEDDIVEMKDGILFVNDTNFDKSLELRHTYIISQSEFQKLSFDNKIDKNDMLIPMGEKVMLALDDSIAEEYNLSEKMKIDPKGQADQIVKKQYSENWNFDNFGPLKIPNGKCFFIGDNRHNSADSRYIGLINENDIVGKVITK